MSTYAVFGMTRPYAIDIARKVVNRQINNGRQFVPEPKCNQMVDEQADKVMASSKCVMLSEKFDAPRFAKDFKNLATKIESRDLHIKAYCKTGQTEMKTGKPKMHWVALALLSNHGTEKANA